MSSPLASLRRAPWLRAAGVEGPRVPRRFARRPRTSRDVRGSELTVHANLGFCYLKNWQTCFCCLLLLWGDVLFFCCCCGGGGSAFFFGGAVAFTLLPGGVFSVAAGGCSPFCVCGGGGGVFVLCCCCRGVLFFCCYRGLFFLFSVAAFLLLQGGVVFFAAAAGFFIFCRCCCCCCCCRGACDGVMFLTASHARHKKKARGLEGVVLFLVVSCFVWPILLVSPVKTHSFPDALD